jgi:LuxR family maltose regulon positive regulatory protein
MSGARTPAARESPEVQRHKFFAPTAIAGTILRSTLIERVLQTDAARVVLLQGPAGHGKSTTLQQLQTICRERGSITAWLTLDEGDNDTRRFYQHVQAMVAGVIDSPVGDSGGRRRSDWLIERLQAASSPVVLVLDDFQVLSNKTVLAFFREVFERVPANTRLFIGTRSMPEIGLTRLVVNQRAFVLHADDLRFSPAEVEQFFRGAGGDDVSNDEVAAIYRRTEGWPAALQLFRLSLKSPTVRRSLGDLTSYRPRDLAEYLADNVLALQPPDIQNFLRRTSLLQRLSASLCHAVTGRADSQELLLKLERTGLFVRSLDTDLRWFKYHALFASFLVEQLQEKSPDTVQEVHRIAARWHLERGDYEDTVRHAIACKDFTLAADTLDTWASQLVADAQIITLERWFEQLPFEEVAKRPSLLIKCAWALVFLHRRQKVKPLLKLLESRATSDADANIVLSMAAISTDDVAGSERWVQRVPLREVQAETFAAFELGAAANLAAYHALGASQFETARSLLALARAHNERGSAIFSGGYTVGMHGMYLLAQGQLREALDGFRAGMAQTRMHADNSVASAAMVACYIWVLYEANELDQAEALFGRYHDIISESALLDFFVVAYLAIVRIHDARGRSARALEVLDEAESIGHGHGWERLIRVINWERARRALLAGGIERAIAISALQGATDVPANRILFSEDAEGEALGRLRLAIHCMDLDTATSMLAVEYARSRGRIYRQIKLNLLEALLHQRREESNGAQRCLKKALQLAAPGGFVRCFLDEGEGVLQLLRESYQRLLESEDDELAPGVRRSFVEQLLQASGTDLSRNVDTRGARPVEPLTDREKEILVFLANGVSNKEMASRLFVSENTVKFHLKNIYSKLAVGSRLQAINAGRKLGLIH